MVHKNKKSKELSHEMFCNLISTSQNRKQWSFGNLISSTIFKISLMFCLIRGSSDLEA